jgi:hypothetical protein
MLTYDDLKDHRREFLAETGLTRDEFERLGPVYHTSYAEQYPAHLTAKGKVRQRQSGGGSKGILRQDEDRLLFTRVYLKTNPLQTMQGWQFGLGQAQANLMPIIFNPCQRMTGERSHQVRDCTPVRSGPDGAHTAGPRPTWQHECTSQSSQAECHRIALCRQSAV